MATKIIMTEENLQEMCRETRCIAFQARLVLPGGEVIDYLRLIESPDSINNESLWKFFTDDANYALRTKFIEERENGKESQE